VSDGSDFASFVVARWPALVRSLVLLGHEQAVAEEAAVAGLARCQPTWDRVRGSGDVDAHVYRLVREQLRRGPRRTDVGAEAPPPLAFDATLADRSERLELLADLQRALERLPAEQRTVLVLRYSAGLDHDQVAAVLGWPVAVVLERDRRGLAELASGDSPRWRPDGFEAGGVFVEAGEVIPVRNPPVDGVLARAAEARRRRRRWTVGLAAGAVVVLAASTWWTTRPTGPQLPETVVTPAPNPANIEWYANRTLHLADVAVEEVPQIAEMVPVADGVVYGDQEGLVVRVRPDGTMQKLGETVPDRPVVGSAERGWVAWVEAGESRDRMVVYDVLRGERVAARSVPRGATPVALDRDDLYYTSPGRDWTWQPLESGATWTSGGHLVDVASGVKVSQVDEGQLRITQPLFDVEVMVPGEGAILSPDGDYVLTRVDEPDPETTALYEAASGDLVDVGLTREEIVVAAAFEPDGSAVFLVEHRANAREPGEDLRLSTTGPQLMRSCEYEFEAECQTVTQFASSAGVSVLPD
jgi:Sigma-70, region 4